MTWAETWSRAGTLGSATTELECRLLYSAGRLAEELQTVRTAMHPASLPLHAVEIGTWHGRTALVMHESAPSVPLTTIDPFVPYVDVGQTGKTQTPTLEEVRGRLDERRGHEIRIVKGRSVEVAQTFAHPVGFLFVDGDHGLGPEEDWRAWSRLLVRDAIVCFHDYVPEHPSGPYAAVARLVDDLLKREELYVLDRVGNMLATGLLGKH